MQENSLSPDSCTTCDEADVFVVCGAVYEDRTRDVNMFYEHKDESFGLCQLPSEEEDWASTYYRFKIIDARKLATARLQYGF